MLAFVMTIDALGQVHKVSSSRTHESGVQDACQADRSSADGRGVLELISFRENDGTGE